MSAKPRILFVGESVSLAHVSRPLVLAKGLDPTVFDVHFACDERYRWLIEPHEHFTYWPLPSVPTDAFLAGVDRGGYIFEPDVIEQYIQDETAIYRSVRPDLVVADLRFSVCVSAPASGIRSATVVNAHWSSFRDLGFDEFPFGDPLAEGSSTGPSFTGRLKRRVGRELQRFRPASAPTLDPNTRNFNQARTARGLAPFGRFTELATAGDFVLYAEPEGFIRMTDVLPNHHFLGPILWSPDSPLPDWWQTWDADRPLIYATLGSTGFTSALHQLVSSLADLGATVVVTTAGRAEVGEQPANVYIADFLPGLELCAIADVVVCNGGSATAYQSLQQGTPIVGVWSNQDQYMTSTIIERAGAGRSVRATTESAATIAATVSDVLHDPRYRAGAKRLAELFRSADAPRRFAAFAAETTAVGR